MAILWVDSARAKSWDDIVLGLAIIGVNDVRKFFLCRTFLGLCYGVFVGALELDEGKLSEQVRDMTLWCACGCALVHSGM